MKTTTLIASLFFCNYVFTQNASTQDNLNTVLISKATISFDNELVTVQFLWLSGL